MNQKQFKFQNFSICLIWWWPTTICYCISEASDQKGSRCDSIDFIIYDWKPFCYDLEYQNPNWKRNTSEAAISFPICLNLDDENNKNNNTIKKWKKKTSTLRLSYLLFPTLPKEQHIETVTNRCVARTKWNHFVANVRFHTHKNFDKMPLKCKTLSIRTTFTCIFDLQTKTSSLRTLICNGSP